DAQLSWAPVWPALTSHAQFFAPDLPGYGASPLGPTSPTLEGYRTWLLGFLDAAGIQTAVLAGLSLGGGIALRTALDAPARVAGLVLLGPYGARPRLPAGKMGYFAAHAPRTAATTQTALRHSARLLRASLRALLHRPDAVTDELVGVVRALLTRPGAGAAWQAFQRHEAGWTRPRAYLAWQLGAIGCPVLLFSGGYDRLVPPPRRLPGAAVVRWVRPARPTRRRARCGDPHPPRPLHAGCRRRPLAAPRRPRAGRRPADRVPDRRARGPGWGRSLTSPRGRTAGAAPPR